MKIFATILGLSISLTAFAQNNNYWKLKSVREGAKMTDVSNKESQFVISIKEKKFSGSVGCNTFKGKLEFIKGNDIIPVKLVNTKAKCPEELDRLDYAVLEAINLSDQLIIKEDVAEFYNAGRIVLELNR